MQRIAMPERPGWRDQAESLGFRFHSIGGEPYWDESVHYRFTLPQIEAGIEQPTQEVHELCMDLVSRAVRDEEYLRRLALPERFWDLIRSSWTRGDPHLYGRMDFAYDGENPAKLFELNYDTPTSLYEAAVFQWIWLKECVEAGQLPPEADQFNSLQEKLTLALGMLVAKIHGQMHFASVRESIEDRATVEYLEDLARQAGIRTRYIAMEDIGRTADGRYTDCDDNVIEAIFKLYPWEFLFADEFSQYLECAAATWFEPPWKSILSNKGALALLWELHPQHPHLLPTFFETHSEAASTLPCGWVRKPLFSREGANVELMTLQGEHLAAPGPYSDFPYVRQAFHALPKFADSYALIGSWVIGDLPAGIGVREDHSLITRDTARFVPHIVI
ncbi:MAG TPA: glutathionylspermidine synthase family protein [Steroidobacteraceae bacterium]